jgi:hypothetical protein
MNQIPPLLAVVGTMTGILLALVICWQVFIAIMRLVLVARTTSAVSLLLARLASAVREGRTWEPVLRGLRLEMAWPWPWRLGRAADRLAAGVPPGEVLVTSGLLPASLRTQAAQALSQGPTAFAQWCTAIADREPANPLAVRQQAFLLAECTAIVGVLWFMAIFIVPKFEQILRDLGVQAPPVLAAFVALIPYALPLLVGLVLTGVAGWSIVLAMGWYRRRRHAAARLLLSGSVARLPEAALGPAGGFAELCAAVGWQAADPAELARCLAREEGRDALRNAWLPALVAALAPIIAAIPIGLVVIGIMQVFVAILTSIEIQS